MLDSWFPDNDVPGSATSPADWRVCMVEAVTVPEIASVLVRTASGLAGVRRSRLLWELDPALSGGQAPAPDETELDLADAALMAGAPHRSDDGLHLAIPLPASTAVLLLQLEPGADAADIASRLAPPIRVVDRKLCRSLQISEL